MTELPRELIARTLQAVARVVALSGSIRHRRIEAEAKALGIDAKQFRRLLRADHPNRPPRD